MKPPVPDIDWRALRGSILLFAFAMAVGGAMAGGAIRFHDEATLGHERQKGRLESARSRYRTIDEQRRLIRTWLPAFRDLQAEGVIGEESRLAWIETLREVADSAQLPSLRYRIEPRTAYEAGPALDGAYRSFSTVMHVEAGLLHEGDLERLFRELETRSTGLYRIERCEVHRTGPEFVMRSDATNLAMQCDLRWITLARDETRS